MTAGRKGKIFWTGLVVFLALALAAGAFFWLSQSSLMSVDQVKVEGNIVVPADFIIETAGPYLRGRSLLERVDQRAAEVLTEVPYIKSVDFDRRFPDTIYIEVIEYQPVLSLAASESFYLMASDDTAIMKLEQPRTDMPLLATREACEVAAGERLECPDANTGVQFVADIPPNFNYKFADLYVENGRISATTTDGSKVNFGTLDQYELKFEVLRQLLARSASPGVTVTIDVSVPERPVTREGEEQPAVGDMPAEAAGDGEAESDSQGGEGPAAEASVDEDAAPASDEPVEGAAVDGR